jgi:hypothetical protein
MLLTPEESRRVVEANVRAMYPQGATRNQVLRYLMQVEGGVADMSLADSLPPDAQAT